jgi:hypothetical protein
VQLTMTSEGIDLSTLTSGMLRLKAKVKFIWQSDINGNSRQAKTEGMISAAL